MKSFLYVLLGLVAFSCLCIVTCPDKKDHSDALVELVNEVMRKELMDDTEGYPIGMEVFGTMLGTEIVNYITEYMLSVENYFVCSIGKITYNNKEYVISVGLLNHVFTKDTEEIEQDAKGFINCFE